MAGKSFTHVPRHTSRGIVLKDGNILLMERWRPGFHYFSIPGGGIEDGETALQTVVREIAEETSVQVAVGPEVLQMQDENVTHHIFLCTYISGIAALASDAPEQDYGPNNKFQPGWFPVADLKNLPFIYWQPIKQPLIDGLANGFKDGLTIVSAAQTS